MKRYFKITILALIILVTACIEKFDISMVPSSVVPSIKEYYLTIGQKEFIFPNIMSNASTSVNSSGVWNFVGFAPWLTINPAQGSEGSAYVTFTAADNSTTDQRLTIFELQSPENDEGWHANYTIRATQLATEAYIKVSNTDGSDYNGSARFDGKENEKDFYVDSNCKFKISSSADWASCSDPVDITETRKRITVKIEENKTSEARNCIITLRYEANDSTSTSLGTEINLHQEPAQITATSDALEYTYIGGTGVINFNSQAQWKAYTTHSFIKLIADGETTFEGEKETSITGKAGNGTFGIEVLRNSSQNARTGAIYITINEKDIISIPIEQGNVTMSIDESYHTLSFTSSMPESKTIVINSNAAYTLTSTENWISFNEKGNGVVEITANDNPSLNSRNATINVTSTEDAGLYQDIAVLQSGKTFSLSSPDNQNLNYSRNGDTQNIILYTNAKWSASTSSEWIKLGNTGGTPSNLEYITIPVTVLENTTTTYRRASVDLMMEDKQATITIDIFQDPAEIEVGNSSFNFSNKADSTTLYFSTNSPWTASAEEDWITITPDSGTPTVSGMQQFKVKIAVTDNKSTQDRHGTIYLRMFGEERKISITQSSASLNLDQNKITFKNTPDTTTVSFYAEGDWSARADAAWIKISPESGAPSSNGINTKMEISVTANSSANPRNGKVVLSMYDTYREIEITQEGAYMNFTTDSVSFSHYASKKDIKISTNGLWSASSNSDWITVGQSMDTLKISVTDNKTTSARNGKVTVVMYDGSWTIKVHQKPSQIELGTEAFSFSHTDGSKDFYIQTDAKWEIEIDPAQSWLSVDKTSGGSDDNYKNTFWITAKVTHNNENKQRTGKIIVSTKSEVKVVTVTQDQKYLEIDSPALDFSATGGSATITVTKNTDSYNVYSDSDWVTVKKTEWNNTIKVTTTYNPSRYSRSAIVTIENDYNKSYKLNLTQSGRTISVSESGAEFFAKGGSATTTATVEGEFTVSVPSGSWVSATHEDNTNKIVLTAQENETGAERTGTVTVSLAGQPSGEEIFSKSFNVKQYPYTNKIYIDGFEGADKDVKLVSGKGFSIKIVTYTTDKDYNRQNFGGDTNVGKYGDDKGKDKNGNGNINLGGYGEDKKYD